MTTVLKEFIFPFVVASAGVTLLYHTERMCLNAPAQQEEDAQQIGHALSNMQVSHFLGYDEFLVIAARGEQVRREAGRRTWYLWVIRPWPQPNSLGLFMKKNDVRHLSCLHQLRNRGWEMAWQREGWGTKLPKHQEKPGTVRRATDRRGSSQQVKT